MEALTILVSIGALLVSGGSLCVAIASFRKNSRTSKRLLEIETDREIDRKREKGKAILTAKIESKQTQDSSGRPRHTWWSLKIENKGSCEARNIKIDLGDKPVLDSGLLTISSPDKVIKHTGPKSEFHYQFDGANFRSKIPLHCLITWEDDSGEPGEYETSLTEP